MILKALFVGFIIYIFIGILLYIYFIIDRYFNPNDYKKGNYTLISHIGEALAIIFGWLYGIIIAIKND